LAVPGFEIAILRNLQYLIRRIKFIEFRAVNQKSSLKVVKMLFPQFVLTTKQRKCRSGSC
jgi:hypothetical protein